MENFMRNIKGTSETEDSLNKRHFQKRSKRGHRAEYNALIDLTEENHVESSEEEESTSNNANTRTKEHELSWLSGAIARAREMRFVKFFDSRNTPEPYEIYNIDSLSSSEHDIKVQGESANELENDSTAVEIAEEATNAISLNECAKSINDESVAASTSLATEIEENASISTLSQLHDKDNSSSAVQIDQNISESTSLSKHDELVNINPPEHSSSLQEAAESSLLQESTEGYDVDSFNNDSQTKESVESESSSISKYIRLHDPDSPKNYSQDETDDEASDCSTLTRLLRPIDPDGQCTKDNDKELSSPEHADFQATHTENSTEILDLSTARSAESREVLQPVTENTLHLQENNLVDANASIKANETIKDINSAVDDAISEDMVVDSPTNTNLSKGIRRKNTQVELTNYSPSFSGAITQSCQPQLSEVTRAEISQSVFSNEPEAIDFSMKTYELVNNIQTPSASCSNKPENQIPSANALVDIPVLKNRIWNPAQSDIKSSSNTAIQEDETGLNVSPIISEGMISTDTENLVLEIENDVTLLPLKKRKRHSTINNQAGDDFAPSNIDSHSEDSYSESLQLYNRKINHKNTDDVAYSPTPRFSIANFHGFGINDINIDKSSYSNPSVKPIHYNMPTCLEKPPSVEKHQLPHPQNPQIQLSEKHQLLHQENRSLIKKKHQELFQRNQLLIYQEKPTLPQPENHQLAHQQNPPLPQPQNHQLTHQPKPPLPQLEKYQLPQQQEPSLTQYNPLLLHQEKLKKIKAPQQRRKKKTPLQLPDNHQPPQQEERQLQQHQRALHQENLQLLDRIHHLARQEQPSPLQLPEVWYSFWRNQHPSHQQLFLERYQQLIRQYQNSVVSQQQLKLTAYSEVFQGFEVTPNSREAVPHYGQFQSIPPQLQMPYMPFSQESFRRHRHQIPNLIPTQLVDDAAHRQRILHPATYPTQMVIPSPQQFQRSTVPQLETASEGGRLYGTVPAPIFNQFGRY